MRVRPTSLQELDWSEALVQVWRPLELPLVSTVTRFHDAIWPYERGHFKKLDHQSDNWGSLGQSFERAQATRAARTIATLAEKIDWSASPSRGKLHGRWIRRNDRWKRDHSYSKRKRCEKIESKSIDDAECRRPNNLGSEQQLRVRKYATQVKQSGEINRWPNTQPLNIFKFS